MKFLKLKSIFYQKMVFFATSRYLLDFSLYHQNQNKLLSLRIYLGDFDDIIYGEFKEFAHVSELLWR